MMARSTKNVSSSNRARQLTDVHPEKFERAYENCIQAIEGLGSAREVQDLIAKVARARATNVEQIGRKIGLLMGRRFQESQTDPEWLLLCSIKRDLSHLL
jgi:hypothetical protein